MPKTFKFLFWSGKKAVASLVLTIVLSVAIVGATLAYIIDITDALDNTFTPPTVDIEISGNTVTNKSDVDVYIRAAVVVTWVNTTDGTTLSTAPMENTDYTLDPAEGWVKGSDGFYYYTSKVLPNVTSVTVLDGVTAQSATNGEYTLTVQVLSSAIQADPSTAVMEAWESVAGVDASTGALTIEQ